MKTPLFNLKNLLLPISILLAMNCSTPSSSQKNTSIKKTIQNPSPVMEPQVDSLKKGLDEKRRSKK
jgi:hypothetical protein